MKKFSVFLFSMLVICLCLIGCSKKDGKCNECGEMAYEVTETDKEYMKKLGIKYKDELCQEHYQQKMMEEVQGSLSSLFYAMPDSDYRADLIPDFND